MEADIATNPVLSTDRRKPRRGPRQLEYIPEPLRHISGVEHLGTIRQLDGLICYIGLPPTRRPPFLRLGASVPPRSSKSGPSAVYAVTVDGEVQVIFRLGDPRRSHHWAQNAKRPWNLCRNPQLAGSAMPSVNVRVVTLATFDGESPVAPEWTGSDVPASLVPDGVSIINAWACRPHMDAGGVDREFIVEGIGEWWESLEMPDLASVRAARGHVYSHVDGMIWIGESEVVQFPAYSFGDGELMWHAGQVIDDVLAFLKGRLVERVRLRVQSGTLWGAALPADKALEDTVARHTRRVDFRTVGLAEVRAVEDRVVAALCAVEEVAS